MYARILLISALGLMLFAAEQRSLFAQTMMGVPGFQQQQQQEHPCQADFNKLKNDIQSKGEALQAAGKRKATAVEPPLVPNIFCTLGLGLCHHSWQIRCVINGGKFAHHTAIWYQILCDTIWAGKVQKKKRPKNCTKTLSNDFEEMCWPGGTP